MKFSTLAEYQNDIRKRFETEGRPVTPRQRYYSFAQIDLDYGIKEEVPSPLIVPPSNGYQQVKAHLTYLQNKLNQHLDKGKNKDRI